MEGKGQLPLSSPPETPPPFSQSAPTPTPSTEGGPEEDVVMSEVHLGCPPNFSGPRISYFTFSVRPCMDSYEEETTSAIQEVGLDEDGDLVLTRRSRRSKDRNVITIQHSITSSIPNVGLQVWRAELVLADFVLHKMFISSEFNGIVAIELGAGVGLVGMLTARVAKTVFLTDHVDGVLDNCVENVRMNTEMFHSHASVRVRKLNWNESWPLKVVENSPSGERHSWTLADIAELQNASLILAADVIYSDDLTDAFFTTLERLMTWGPEKVVYIALEKRYNFTLDDLDVVANGYSNFRSHVRDEEDLESRWLPCFVGKCIDLTQIPEYMKGYDRGNDVELWYVKYLQNN